MVNKATPDKTIPDTLQRGKACLRCRLVSLFFIFISLLRTAYFDPYYRKRKMASLFLPHTIPFSISTLDSDVMALSQRANNV